MQIILFLQAPEVKTPLTNRAILVVNGLSVGTIIGNGLLIFYDRRVSVDSGWKLIKQDTQPLGESVAHNEIDAEDVKGSSEKLEEINIG